MTDIGILAVAEEGAKATADYLSGLSNTGLLALGVVIFGSLCLWFVRRDNTSANELRKELQRWQTEHLTTVKETAIFSQRMLSALDASTVAVTTNTAALAHMARASEEHARALDARAMVDIRMAANIDNADEMRAENDALRKEVNELHRSAPARAQGSKRARIPQS